MIKKSRSTVEFIARKVSLVLPKSCLAHQRGFGLIYEEQAGGPNKLAGAVFGTITFSDEGTVWMATGVSVRGSPSTWTGNG
ncbi:MAG: hypothetical protein MUO80_05995, partial [Dehalococcoidia bacterium]|nr:hypothetical protein [Dehalococcoidia bacterium]